MRLWRRRRRDAMEEWRRGVSLAAPTAPSVQHGAPDLDPSDVPPPRRVGFDGQPLPEARGGLTGLESGAAGTPPPVYGG